MKELTCQNMLIRWLGIVPVYCFLIYLHTELLNTGYITGIVLMILGIWVLFFITEHMTYYYVKVLYEEHNNDLDIFVGHRKYIIKDVKDVSCLPKNFLGFEYSILLIRCNDCKLKLCSTTKEKDNLYSLFNRIIDLNNNLSQEKDIWGNPIDIWSIQH